MERREYTLNRSNVRDVMVIVWEHVRQLVLGYDVTLVISGPDRTREQEKHYHWLIRQIALQVSFASGPVSQSRGLAADRQRRYSPEVWKALMIDMFQKEKEAIGEPLKKPGQLVPSLDGERLVSLRASTKHFNRQEGSDFIEFCYAQGTEMGVRWPAKVHEILESERMGMISQGEEV